MDKTTQPFSISQQKLERVLCIALQYRNSIQTSCLFQEQRTTEGFECFQINFRWQRGPLRVSESETQLESIGIQPSEVPCSSKKYVTGRELLFGSKIHTAGSRIKKALWEMSANVNHYF